MQTHFSDRKRAYNLLQATAFGDASADMNLVSVRTRVGGAARTVAILDEDGDWNYDGTAQNTIWDEYDDVVLLSGLRASVISEKEQLGERWQEWLEYARPVLERTGVVHYNEDGHHFISTKYLNMLQIDAIRQLAERVEALKLEIAVLIEAICPQGKCSKNSGSNIDG